eukprot:m.218600 g.218600  ORF g.218600 m.218600 type:complete len:530 (-) comp15570_c0_seq9:200-1789(-)
MLRRSSKREKKKPASLEGPLQVQLQLSGKAPSAAAKKEAQQWAIAAREQLYADVGVTGFRRPSINKSPPEKPHGSDQEFQPTPAVFPGMGANPVGVQLIDSVARGTDTARSVKTNSFIVDGEEDHPTLTRSRSSKRKEVRRSEIGSPMDFRHLEHGASPQEAMHVADVQRAHHTDATVNLDSTWTAAPVGARNNPELGHVMFIESPELTPSGPVSPFQADLSGSCSPPELQYATLDWGSTSGSIRDARTAAATAGVEAAAQRIAQTAGTTGGVRSGHGADLDNADTSERTVVGVESAPWLVIGADRDQLKWLTAKFVEKSPVGNFFIRDGVKSVDGGLGLTVKLQEGVKKFLIQKYNDGFQIRGLKHSFRSLADLVSFFSSEEHPAIGVRLQFRGIPKIQPSPSEKPSSSVDHKPSGASLDALADKVADRVLTAQMRRERKLDDFADRVADKLLEKQAVAPQSTGAPGSRKQRPRDSTRDRLLGHGGPTPAQAAAEALRREAEKNGGVIPTADPYHDQKNGKSPRAARR